MTRYEPRNADGEWIVYDKPELGRAGGWYVSHTPPNEERDAEPREPREPREVQHDLFA